MANEIVALIGLSITLLVTIITSVWKLSSLSTKLTDAVENLQDKDDELRMQVAAVKEIPTAILRLDFLERNYSQLPELISRIRTVELQIQHSKEMRKLILRQSRPDSDDHDK